MPKQFRLTLLRAYEVAREIDLDLVQSRLAGRNFDKFRITRFQRELSIKNPPVVVHLGLEYFNLLGQSFKVEITGKIWTYGAITISFQTIVETTSFDELSDIVNAFEDDQGTDSRVRLELDQRSRELVDELLKELEKCCQRPKVWDEFEDYTIVQFISARGPKDLPEQLNFDTIARLMEGEKDVSFSEQTLSDIKAGMMQYSDEDLIVADWNRAFVAGDAQEVQELSWILEYTLCQLLELRYYEHLLDDRLQYLYHMVEKKKSSFWFNRYNKVALEAAMTFMEISELVEELENSFKIFADTYYARVYSRALNKFNLIKWRETVSNKLKNLSEISDLFAGNINEKRNQLMELIIIILIAIEVVPFVWNLVH